MLNLRPRIVRTIEIIIKSYKYIQINLIQSHIHFTNTMNFSMYHPFYTISVMFSMSREPETFCT